MHDTFGPCVLWGPDRATPFDGMTRCMTHQIRKRVSLDRTRCPIEDVSPKTLLRGRTHDTLRNHFHFGYPTPPQWPKPDRAILSAVGLA